jgi:hypothetical protein
MQQGGAQRRPTGNDTNRRSTIMIQMMMSTLGGVSSVREAQQRQGLMLRKSVGFAIVLSGWTVIVVQALQHTLGA